MNPKIDEYIANSTKWQKEMLLLRELLLDCNLIEEIKWRVPCYTFNNANIAIIGNFKDYVALSFLKGVLLADTDGLLVSPGENSQSVRYLKFTNDKEINKLKKIITAYIFEAIEVEKLGLKADLKKSTDLVFPEELLNKMAKDKAFKTAFEKLTPGRQRGYNLFFSSAKQSKSREARIEKYVGRILKGQGIHDCVCGHSKRMPTCDGSHKYL